MSCLLTAQTWPGCSYPVAAGIPSPSQLLPVPVLATWPCLFDCTNHPFYGSHSILPWQWRPVREGRAVGLRCGYTSLADFLSGKRDSLSSQVSLPLLCSSSPHANDLIPSCVETEREFQRGPGRRPLGPLRGNQWVCLYSLFLASQPRSELFCAFATGSEQQNRRKPPKL